MDKPCRTVFDIYYQKGNFIKEHVEEHCKTPEQRQKVWARHMEEFNDKLEAFRRQCKKSYEWL